MLLHVAEGEMREISRRGNKLTACHIIVGGIADQLRFIAR
jgi:hypothetical protein